MDLATVTCNRDVSIMLLQAKSVQEYLEPGTTHWVFINEEPDKLFDIDWEYILSPYYTNHNLKVIYCDTKYWDLIHNGWIIQQVHKLEISKIINSDYMLLDSKNFFVVPTKLSTWVHEGSGVVISKKINLAVWNLWDSTNSLYSVETGFPKLKEYYAAETPFIIRDSVVKAITSKVDFAKRFIECYSEADASEFIYYSYFLKASGGDIKYNRRHHGLWPGHNDVDAWFNEEDFKIMEISGIHRIWLETASESNKEKIKNWLGSLNLIDEHTSKLFD